MRLDLLLERLGAVRNGGNGWMATCPAHRDRSPSLSLRESNGRLLLHCFAGCSIEAICEALEIRLSDLFNESRPSHDILPRIVREAQKEIVSLRGKLLPRDRERPVTVIKTNVRYLDFGIARAPALAVEGEFVQIVLDEEAE
jgi:hypothetical protein